jgi:hypothetical protein
MKQHARFVLHLLRLAASFAGLLLASGSAYANVPLFAVFQTVPLTLIALAPVIAVESWLCARMLKLALPEAIKVAAAGNIASTLVGVVITGLWIVTEPMWMVLLKLFAPFFLASWLVEFAVAKAMLKPLASRPIWRATLAANALSYAILALLIGTGLWSLKAQDEQTIRQLLYVELLINSAHYAERNAIEEFVAKNKRFPEHLAELDTLAAGKAKRPHTKAIQLTQDGLRVTFSAPEFPQIDNSSIEYSLALKGERAKWTCRSETIPVELLPRSCTRLGMR